MLKTLFSFSPLSSLLFPPTHPAAHPLHPRSLRLAQLPPSSCRFHPHIPTTCHHARQTRRCRSRSRSCLRHGSGPSCPDLVGCRCSSPSSLYHITSLSYSLLTRPSPFPRLALTTEANQSSDISALSLTFPTSHWRPSTMRTLQSHTFAPTLRSPERTPSTSTACITRSQVFSPRIPMSVSGVSHLVFLLFQQLAACWLEEPSDHLADNPLSLSFFLSFSLCLSLSLSLSLSLCLSFFLSPSLFLSFSLPFLLSLSLLLSPSPFLLLLCPRHIPFPFVGLCPPNGIKGPAPVRKRSLPHHAQVEERDLSDSMKAMRSVKRHGQKARMSEAKQRK